MSDIEKVRRRHAGKPGVARLQGVVEHGVVKTAKIDTDIGVGPKERQEALVRFRDHFRNSGGSRSVSDVSAQFNAVLRRDGTVEFQVVRSARKRGDGLGYLLDVEAAVSAQLKDDFDRLVSTE